MEIVLGIRGRRFRCLHTLLQSTNEVTSMVLSCICVPYLLRLCDGNKNVSVADQDDNNTNIIPGQ
ncbi:hypothetical protein DPMN_173687 [Dreissena polymorpha]|uniref:Uncharacterized protein n=1 Tax=Dreissena polymorpha TaxID=45954 RepID=A0A9D4E5K4_DREPO|nr:hypothetical protein DPMN_173687 [Dreissena polymorpha]